MDDFELNIFYLHSSDGEINSMKYEFGCQSRNKDQQSNASFFVIPIDEISEDEDFEERMIEESSPSKESVLLGGLIYCNWKGLADKFKNEFIWNFKSTIYFHIGNYLEAFKCALNCLQDHINSLELVSETSKQVWSGYDALSRTQVSANFFLKQRGELYLSKSIHPVGNYRNVWCVKEKGRTQFRQINVANEAQYQTNEYYLLNEELTNRLHELILSDSSTKEEAIVSEGKIVDTEYEFASAYNEDTGLNNAAFFIQELPQIEEPEQEEQEQNSAIKQQQHGFLAGFLYGEHEELANKVKQYLISSIAENIYFKLGEHREGFKNIIAAAYDYFDSIILPSNSSHNRVVINLLLKVGEEIYLSHQTSTELSSQKQDPFLNQSKIMHLEGEKYLNLTLDQEHLNLICDQFWQLKPEFTKFLKQIILTYDQCPNMDQFENVQEHYPSERYVFRDINYLSFLKIKLMN